MGEKKWTAEQLQAIEERGRSILVSAGAGSGKTAVMVERATRLILDERVPVSGMLVVTFTNAAAAEMRERLRKALKERLAACIAGSASEQEWIRQQLDDLHNAQISTFHSFAQRVIREFFYLTELEPGARVLDEAEAEVLKEEALDELFESEYEENSDDFRAFLDSYSGDKSDSNAREMVLSLYAKLEAVPDGLNVLDEKIGELEADSAVFKKTEAYRELLKLCRRDFDAAMESARKTEDFLREYGLGRLADRVREDLSELESLAAEFESGADGGGDLDDAAERVKNIRFVTLAAKKDEKEAYEQIKEVVKALRESYKSIKNDIGKLWYSDLDNMLAAMNMTVPFARTAARLIRRFDGLFREIKNDHKGIDYADMEHFAYEILQHKEAQDHYRELFRYIFIDEYQDTNYMQETIAGLVSRPDNVFMVGDIKQSIYHFRLADPEIFQNKYDMYKRGMHGAGTVEEQGAEGGTGQGKSPVAIDLNRNFRSKPAVIREINKMFRPLMDGYDEDAELKCGVEEGEHALPAPKTYIVDRADTAAVSEQAADASDTAGAELEDMKKEELEAMQAVRIIRDSLGKEFTDPASGTVRKVDYRDIVILMRSFRRSAEGYREIFRTAGIPLYIDDKDGYFDTIEINVALSLLQVIDNKRQDVPFIALLRSEIFGFSCEELALIRKLHRKGSYVEAAEAVAGIRGGSAGGSDPAGTRSDTDTAKLSCASGEACEDAGHRALREKCLRVFNEIKKWQTYAVTLPLSDMIWRILNETGYYVIAGTFPGGAGRQANLRLLADRAKDYQERSLGSLYGFIRYIDTLKKSKVRMPQATLLSENENVVRIMTIHHSKGLEFPVVILAGMDNQPKGGSSGEISFDRVTGLGLRARDPVRHLRESTLIQRLAGARDSQAETNELKRAFYVAVTRARETFYLLGASEYDKVMANLEAGHYSDTTLLRMSRYLPEVVRVPASGLLSKPLSPSMTFLPAEEGSEKEAAASGKETSYVSGKPSEEAGAVRARTAEIVGRLGYVYPYAAAADLAAKTSVTGINRKKMRSAVVTGPGEQTEENFVDTQDTALSRETGSAYDEGRSAGTTGARESRFSGAVPSFIRSDNRISAARIGTIYHKIMEKLDFGAAGREGYAYITRRAAELVNAGIFTAEELRSADLKKIAKFFETDLGKRCIAASDASMLYKEQSFESRIEMLGESVLVQGVIDCWLEEEGEEVLIDYKTNRIDRNRSLDGEKARITEMYRTQLEMYADAVEKATGKHVKAKYLYLFSADEAVEVK